jgi:hypothetical protein
VLLGLARLGAQLGWALAGSLWLGLGSGGPPRPGAALAGALALAVLAGALHAWRAAGRGGDAS